MLSLIIDLLKYTFFIITFSNDPRLAFQLLLSYAEFAKQKYKKCMSVYVCIYVSTYYMYLNN